MSIFVMNRDGDDEHELAFERPAASGPVFLLTPTWSPDGTKIAYSRAEFTASGFVGSTYVMQSDGDDRSKLLEHAVDLRWSPDGKRVVYSSDRDRFGRTCFHECSVSHEIYVANADGSEAQRLTRSRASDGSPVWSPDGRWIAFVSDRADPAWHLYRIYRMRPDGSDVQMLAPSSNWQQDPSWQPLGR